MEGLPIENREAGNNGMEKVFLNTKRKCITLYKINFNIRQKH